MNERLEPSASSPSSSSKEPLLLHARREPFEYGLLPIPKLIFSDATSTLIPLKQKLLQKSSSSQSSRINASTISETLQISIETAHLILETLSSVLPSDSDPEIDSVGANINDLILFLYIQSYKRLLPKTHKDSAAVADVWPSTSAFDGCLSALSPLQFVRSNSRRFMPSQADEEAHQLSYLQKHLANILALLAEPAEGNEDESLVLTLERFEHLGFLIQFGEKGSERNLLSQAAPFFANSDPDMPAIPVPAAQVHDWVLQNIVASLEHTAEKVSPKETSPNTTSDLDVTMVDASTSHLRSQNSSPLSGASMHSNAAYSRSQTFVEGISKSSVVKQASDIKGCSVKVINCHDSMIYILAPLRYATVYGCSDATIVLGAIGKSVRVEHCERVHVITAAKRICIANCRECVFFLGVNQRPLILGDNHKLQVAPYNTFYSQLEEHMTQVGIDATVNRWDQPLVLGMVDPHDSLSHPAGVSDVQAESSTCLDPDQFTDFLIPNWFGGESAQLTKQNPFPLPEIYIASQRKNHLVLNDIKEALRDLQLEENRKRELASALHVYFKDWLYASGNIRQLYCLQGD
ncbi:uncharacterized protein LOC143849774 [Tasmannia lanceolata]|uniref:uncharacterized protein LOC143849774 n=1 Tax=Tasmannia lanceolata TaxID=3420 RepID=UPI004064640B